MKTNNVFKVIIAIIVCELAGAIGSIFTTPEIATWYSALVKPSFNPPAWIFAPVWATLFALMGIAAFLVWKRGFEKKEVKIALYFFILQLVLNIFWSIIFFGWHSPAGAMIEIIFLCLAILITIILFAKISKAAAWLLVPYILWVSFAGFLNYTIWQMNAGNAQPVACTMEAKICPDGSAVGRSGPKCEFAPCQIAFAPNDLWITSTNPKFGITFQYPSKLTTKYIDTVDWPPQAQLLNRPFSCDTSGSPIIGAGETSTVMIANHPYCMNILTEGAAGSIYTTYFYSFVKDGMTASLSFTLRSVQCDNYNDPQKTECKNERASFNINTVVDSMAQSLTRI